MTDILTVLKGARARLAVAFDRDDCQCEAHEHGKPWPPAVGHKWCPLCAIEAEHVTRKLSDNLFMETLREVARTISTRKFTPDGRLNDADGIVLAWFWDLKQADVVNGFDRTIKRLEAA